MTAVHGFKDILGKVWEKIRYLDDAERSVKMEIEEERGSRGSEVKKEEAANGTERGGRLKAIMLDDGASMMIAAGADVTGVAVQAILGEVSKIVGPS
jgi:hypothetical protein